MSEPTTIRAHLTGHDMKPLDPMRTDGDFQIVACTCGWVMGIVGLVDALEQYADHLRANAVAALDLLDADDERYFNLLSEHGTDEVFAFVYDPKGAS